MSVSEILKSIEKLPIRERFELIEVAKKALCQSEKFELQKASDIMLVEYQLNEELTAFWALD